MPPKKPKHQTHLANLNSARKSTKLPRPASTPKTGTKQTSLLDFRFHTAPKPPPSKPPPPKRRRGAGELREEEVEIPETQVETRNHVDTQPRREEEVGSETESEPETTPRGGGVVVIEDDLGSETESDLDDDDAGTLKPVWMTPKKKIPPTTVIPETPEAARMQAWREREGRVSPTPRGKRRRTVSPVREEVAGRDGRDGAGGGGKKTPRRTMTPVGRDMPVRGATPVGTSTTPRRKATPSRGKSAFSRTSVSAGMEVEPQLEGDSGQEQGTVVCAASSRLTPLRREEPRLARDDEEERVAKASMDVEMGDGTEDQAEAEREEPQEERYPRDRVIPSSQWWEREGSLSSDEEEPEPTLAPPLLQLQSELSTPKPIPSLSAEEATRALAALDTSPLEEHSPIPSTQPEGMEDAGQEDIVMAGSAPAASPASRPPLLPGSSTMSYFDTQVPETQAPETQTSALFSFPPPSPPPPNAAEPPMPPLLTGSSTMSYPDTQARETSQNAQRSRPPSQSLQSSAPAPNQPFSPPPRIKSEPEPSQTETQYPNFPFNPIHTQMPSQIPMSSQSQNSPPSPTPSPPPQPPRRIKREPSSSPSPVRVKPEPETQVPEFPFNPVHTQYPDFPPSSQPSSSSSSSSSPQQEGWRSPGYTPAQTILGRRFGEGRNGGRRYGEDGGDEKGDALREGAGEGLSDSQLLPDELMATFPMPPEWAEMEDEDVEGEGEGSPTQ